MQFDIDSVHRIISNSPRKNGSYNLFFKLSDKIGLKLSVHKYTRDQNYMRQNQCCDVGLGPETYGTIDNVIYNKDVYYGYFTEIVEVFEDADIDSMNLYESEEWVDELLDEYPEFVNGIRKVFRFNDLHIGNIGFKDGQMVCVDFDSFDDAVEPVLLNCF